MKDEPTEEKRRKRSTKALLIETGFSSFFFFFPFEREREREREREIGIHSIERERRPLTTNEIPSMAAATLPGGHQSSDDAGPTDEARRDAAVDLINALKLSSSPQDKAAKVKQLTEALVHVKATRALLPEFVPEILLLQTEANVAVRRELAAFIDALSTLPAETLTLTKAPYLAQVFSTLCLLSRDKSEKVAKRSFMASIALFSSLYRACISQEDVQAIQSCWTSLADLKESATETLGSQAAKGGSKVYCVKYLECFILFLNEAELKVLCMGDPAVYAKFQLAAKGAADTVFGLASFIMNENETTSTLPTPVAIVVLNALGALAKGKPEVFARRSCDVLSTLAAELGSKSKSGGGGGGRGTDTTKVAAVLQSLKQVLLSLAKFEALLQFGVHDICVYALSLLGFDDAANQASKISSRMMAVDSEDSRRPSKRQRSLPADVLDQNALIRKFTTIANQITTILSKDGLHDFEGPVLSPEATADAVLANFGLNLSDFIRADEAEEAADGGQYARSSAEALMDANIAAIHHVNTLSKEDIKFMSLESLKRIFAANLSNLSGQQLDTEEEMSIQDQLLSRIVTIILGNFWDRDRSYCENVLNSLVNHILDQMQRDRGHATSMGLFYAIFALGESFRGVYNALLLKLVKGMRKKLPSHDTALCKLMLEVPILPKNEIVAFLRDMIIMSSDKEGEEEALEWATLGLNTLRDLVFERPSLRRACLTLSLSCAMHKNQGLRAKAIKLVANTLYPVAYLQGDIEKFALQALRQLTTAGDVSSGEVSRHMELFFALCTKKHDLLHELLSMFVRASTVQKQVMNQNVTSLAKLIPPTSPSVIVVVESPPRGSEILLLLMLHSMAEEQALPKQLVKAVQALYRKNGDARFLVPIFADMPKADAVAILPKFVELPETARKTALVNAFSKNPEGRSPGALSASELFVRLHLIDEAKHGIALKKLIDCTSLCFQMKEIFTPKVLSMAIQQLVQYTPLPKLFMRTVIQTSRVAPQLKGFIVNLLARLVAKKIWEDVRQWQGFLMCAKSTAPNSYPVLLQLPTPHLQAGLQRMPDLKKPLVEFIQQDRAIGAKLPRTTLQLLGLI